MLNLSNPWMKLFIHSGKQKFQVRGIFKTVEEANVFCTPNENVPDVGVICEDGNSGLIFVADIKPTA